MVGPVKAPKKGKLVVQPVIPVLSKVVCHSYYQESPPKWNPTENIFCIRQYQRQKFQSKIGYQWAYDEFGYNKTNHIQNPLIFIPLTIVETIAKFNQTYDEHYERQAPGR